MNESNSVHWRVQRDAADIVWLCLDKADSSTNVLSGEVLRELDQHLERLRTAPAHGVVVLSGKSNGFIAGADIKEFTRINGEDSGYRLIHAGQAVLDHLAALPCPTVAALHGFALGGGLELALACRYRVAADEPRLTLGLPEVQLGIHPGFGGTVRAVELLGVTGAMRLMLTGKPVHGADALRMGLIDRLVEPDALQATAREFIERAPRPHRAPLVQRALSWPLVRALVQPSLTAQVARTVPREHYPAPYAIIDLWSRYGARGPDAFEGETRSIARLFTTETARNLIRVFFLQDRLKTPASKSAAALQRVHVIGAGVMGTDIAAWAAMRGCQVTLHDRDATRLDGALARARERVAERLRDPQRVRAATERLRAEGGERAAAEADVIIEAISENLQAKRELFAHLEAHLKPEALLASNTSSLDIGALAESLARPERFVGLHFFNPVAKMPLVEVVSGPATDARTVSSASAFVRQLDKLPLPCRSAPGFLVNRVLAPYLQEAMYAAAEGIPFVTIDHAAVAFGMPVGPIELTDVVGLDVAAHVGEIVAERLDRPVPNLTMLRDRVNLGKLGRKSGAGFYPWHEGKAQKPALIAPAPDDLCDRLILALLNECAACLREGIVADADLVDAAVIFGTGFAPFRGGPLAYARTRGVDAVVERLEHLAERYGERFQPDAGWTLVAGADNVNAAQPRT